MRKATAFLIILLFACAGVASAQETEFIYEDPLSEDFKTAYNNFDVASVGDEQGVHSSARAVTGPYDLDGDGNLEVLLTDYVGGGRVHVIENRGVDTWELVYSTPWQDSTSNSGNARFAVGGDLDGDGAGEILFVSGAGFSETNPDIDNLPFGLHIYEHTGEDDDYGDEPATVLEFESASGEPQPSAFAEQFAVVDVDNDGKQEVLFPANSSNAFDIFYIYSLSGDEVNSDFASFSREFSVNARSDADLGSGSAIAMHPADLDGDGSFEISLHSWNAYNFFNVDIVDGQYVLPDTTGSNPDASFNASAGEGDYVSYFGGVVVDINQDGDDEVFYPTLQTANLAVLNYVDGENVLEISGDNLVTGVVSDFSALGITAGDLDGDGRMELIGSGPSYTAESFMAGEVPQFLRLTEFTGGTGGDPEDPANYSTVQVSTFFAPFDTTGLTFDFVIRDSAGTTVDSFYQSTDPAIRTLPNDGEGPLFAAKMTYLGDADGDGTNELAISFQGVDDTTYVIRQTYDPDTDTYVPTEIVEARPNEHRAFLRVVSGANFSVERERVILPTDYKLSANFPNPFRGSTIFTMELPIQKTVSVKIYDVLGRVVKTLVDDERYAAGEYRIQWDGTNDAGAEVASGVYFYSLQYGNFHQTKQMTLLK